MSATVHVTPVFANGATGELKVTVTSDEFGDSLTGYASAADVLRQAERALNRESRDVGALLWAAAASLAACYGVVDFDGLDEYQRNEWLGKVSSLSDGGQLLTYDGPNPYVRTNPSAIKGSGKR